VRAKTGRPVRTIHQRAWLSAVQARSLSVRRVIEKEKEKINSFQESILPGSGGSGDHLVSELELRTYMASFEEVSHMQEHAAQPFKIGIEHVALASRGQYVVYVIRITRGAYETVVVRRYSALRELHDRLVTRYKTSSRIRQLAFPEKQVFSLVIPSEDDVEDRKRKLDKYLRALFLLPIIYVDQDVRDTFKLDSMRLSTDDFGGAETEVIALGDDDNEQDEPMTYEELLEENKALKRKNAKLLEENNYLRNGISGATSTRSSATSRSSLRGESRRSLSPTRQNRRSRTSSLTSLGPHS